LAESLFRKAVGDGPQSVFCARPYGQFRGTTQADGLVTLAARDRIPAAYPEGGAYPAAGGLMGYGTSLTDASRQIGAYTGNILKGAEPAELPVQQAVRFDLVINRGAATLLGIEVPPQLLAIADEVIE
jgi:putative ABC transport system substrate-binding protein